MDFFMCSIGLRVSCCWRKRSRTDDLDARDWRGRATFAAAGRESGARLSGGCGELGFGGFQSGNAAVFCSDARNVPHGESLERRGAETGTAAEISARHRYRHRQRRLGNPMTGVAIQKMWPGVMATAGGWCSTLGSERHLRRRGRADGKNAVAFPDQRADEGFAHDIYDRRETVYGDGGRPEYSVFRAVTDIMTSLMRRIVFAVVALAGAHGFSKVC